MTMGLILTDEGAQAIEDAYQAEKVVTITRVAYGDGGGKPVTADPATTQLAGPLGDVPFTQGVKAEHMIGGQAVIPAKSAPGKVIREFGLVSRDGVLIAYGAYPETWLPAENDGVLKELVVRFAMPLVHARSVVLEVDPHIATLTIEEGDRRYLNEDANLSDVRDKQKGRDNLDVYSRGEGDKRYVKKAGDEIAWLNVAGALKADSIRAERNISVGEDLWVDRNAVVSGADYIHKRGNQVNGDGSRTTNGLRIEGAGDLFADLFHAERPGQHHFFGVHVANGGADSWLEFRNDGGLHLGGNWPTLHLGGGTILHPDGNIQGSLWGGYLKDYIDRLVAAASNANDNQFVKRIQLGPEVRIGASGTLEYHGPYVLAGFYNRDYDYSTEIMYWRPIQYLIGNTWHNVENGA